MAKVLGAQVLKDLQTFVAAFDTLFGGFRQRAQQTYELLQTKETAFLVVAAPEPDALREAAYFVERLEAEKMPLAGLVVNRASRGRRRAARSSRRSSRREHLRRRHDADGSDRRTCCGCTPTGCRLAPARARLRQRFVAAHPHVPTVVVPALSTDVHDLDGLRAVGELLTA